MGKPTAKGPGKKGSKEKKPKKWTLSIRTLALAQPNKRRVTPKFDPNQEDLCFKVSRAALKSKATTRVLYLAKPMKAVKKFNPAEVKPDIAPVSRAALRAKCSTRNEQLARNINWKLRETMEEFKDRGDVMPKFQKTMELSKTCMYRDMYWPKKPTPPPPPPKTRSAMYRKSWVPPPPKPKAHVREELMSWCAKNSVAIPPRPPPPIKKFKTKPLNYFQNRLKTLAQPTAPVEKLSKRPPPKEGVSKAALKYKISDRVKKMAEPKPIKDPEQNEQGVTEEALKYTATARIKKLGEPRARAQASDGDVKENAFSVKPEALKAWCSPRTKQLAKPKQLKG